MGQQNKHCIMVKSMNGLTQEDKKFENVKHLALKTLKEMSSVIMICLVKTLVTYSMKTKIYEWNRSHQSGVGRQDIFKRLGRTVSQPLYM